MLDRKSGYSQRRHAADQTERTMRGDTRRIAALHTILWEPLYPSWQRQYAIDQLLIHDPQFQG